MKNDIYNKTNLSYKWDKLMNEFNFQKKIINNSFNKYNTLILNKTPTKTKFKRKFFITKRNKDDLFITSENNKILELNSEEKKKIISFNIRKFKNAISSLNNHKLNFSSNELDFSSNINNSEIRNKKIENNKLKQTSSSLSTKASQNKTIYFNSILDNNYNKISDNKFKIKSSSFSSKKIGVNFFKNNDEGYNLKENKRNRVGIKLNQDKNRKKKDKSEYNKKDNIVTSSKFDSLKKLIPKNVFQKSKIKVKSGVLDGIILDYNLNNNGILSKPFNNSYGFMLNLVSEKVKFLKGSLDMIYPSIIQKKYEIKANQIDKKVDLLRNSSLENFKGNRIDIKKDIYKINKNKKIFQSVFAKYPIYIKVKGKFSPHLHSLMEKYK